MAIINGTTGNDTFVGTEGTISIDAWFGFAGDDIINTGSGQGADIVYGGAGNDTLTGGTGADILSGGTGNDVYYFVGIGDVLIESNLGGTDLVVASANWVLGDHFENLTLSELSLVGGTGIGNGLANRLTGNSGANTLVGLGGNDVLIGGAGLDRMVGGADNDIYIVEQAGDVVVESLNGGFDRVDTGLSHTLALNVEQLVLTGAAVINGTGNGLGNRLTGNSAANLLRGGGGNDTLQGAGGADQLWGEAGNDVLIGGAGADVFRFALGRDVVVDLANDVDTIQVDNALWGSTPRTIAQLLAMGGIVGTSAVFDFGGGHVLIVQGVSNLAILGNDMAIV